MGTRSACSLEPGRNSDRLTTIQALERFTCSFGSMRLGMTPAPIRGSGRRARAAPPVPEAHQNQTVPMSRLRVSRHSAPAHVAGPPVRPPAMGHIVGIEGVAVVGVVHPLSSDTTWAREPKLWVMSATYPPCFLSKFRTSERGW
jgi:hypothetical protein